MSVVQEYLEFCKSHGLAVQKFLLQHGQQYEIGPRSFLGSRMTQGMCYMNASHVAFDDPSLKYVEGMVCSYGIPIDHAWNVDHDGKVVDRTMDNHDGRISDYFGVEFNTEYVRKATLKNGCYGLLSFQHNRKTLPALVAGRSKFR